ncbi:MAG: O-antigen ligase family protein [Propionibacteriaceae bacterium]|nr:O-antigen ligase family protein [Propionibacteriaceae bacterium]
MLRLISLLGITLVANDGIRSTTRMHVLVRYLIAGGTAMAALAVFQFVTGQLWVDRISIPGLSQSADLSLDARSGLVRPSATATSPIEFAALVSMIVPIAVMNLRSRPGRDLRRWVPPGLMVLGLMLSLSRTGILCLAAGLLVITPSLPRIWKLIGAAGAAVMVVVLGLTVPGLIGTIRGLFTGLSEDPSVQSRTSSYALAWQFIERNPLIGNGLGTFLPRYWILDNMYLLFIIEAGLLGILALLGLFVTAFVVARRAAALFPAGRERDLAVGLTGGIAGGAASFAFFDALSFPQAACTLFLLIGMSGAYWRLARQPAVGGSIEPAVGRGAPGL